MEEREYICANGWYSESYASTQDGLYTAPKVRILKWPSMITVGNQRNLNRPTNWNPLSMSLQTKEITSSAIPRRALIPYVLTPDEEKLQSGSSNLSLEEALRLKRIIKNKS